MVYKPPTLAQKKAFQQGKNRYAYHLFGAHPSVQKDRQMWQFTLWAPNAKAVSVVGEFCQWDPAAYPMKKQADGLWKLSIPAALFFPVEPQEEGVLTDTYKYAVLGLDDQWVYKADPYGFFSEVRPNTASRLYDLEGY
ncbi:MAG: hypothetical protein GX786_03810, partial [Clostridiales bacterium]|nr:hypothetical protein [Clostridiales bacterium]